MLHQDVQAHRQVKEFESIDSNCGSLKTVQAQQTTVQML
jgi:hypothetical protein